MKYLMLVEVGPDGPWLGDEDDVIDALWGVDMEQAIAGELEQRFMLLPGELDVTVHDAVKTRRITVPRPKKWSR